MIQVALSEVDIADLRLLIDCIYNGCVRVDESDVHAFMVLAERFKIKGLIQPRSGKFIYLFGGGGGLEFAIKVDGLKSIISIKISLLTRRLFKRSVIKADKDSYS